VHLCNRDRQFASLCKKYKNAVVEKKTVAKLHAPLSSLETYNRSAIITHYEQGRKMKYFITFKVFLSPIPILGTLLDSSNTLDHRYTVMKDFLNLHVTDDVSDVNAGTVSSLKLACYLFKRVCRDESLYSNIKRYSPERSNTEIPSSISKTHADLREGLMIKIIEDLPHIEGKLIDGLLTLNVPIDLKIRIYPVPSNFIVSYQYLSLENLVRSSSGQGDQLVVVDGKVYTITDQGHDFVCISAFKSQTWSTVLSRSPTFLSCEEFSRTLSIRDYIKPYWRGARLQDLNVKYSRQLRIFDYETGCILSSFDGNTMWVKSGRLIESYKDSLLVNIRDKLSDIYPNVEVYYIETTDTFISFFMYTGKVNPEECLINDYSGLAFGALYLDQDEFCDCSRDASKEYVLDTGIFTNHVGSRTLLWRNVIILTTDAVDDDDGLTLQFSRRSLSYQRLVRDGKDDSRYDYTDKVSDGVIYVYTKKDCNIPRFRVYSTFYNWAKGLQLDTSEGCYKEAIPFCIFFEDHRRLTSLLENNDLQVKESLMKFPPTQVLVDDEGNDFEFKDLTVYEDNLHPCHVFFRYTKNQLYNLELRISKNEILDGLTRNDELLNFLLDEPTGNLKKDLVPLIEFWSKITDFVEFNPIVLERTSLALPSILSMYEDQDSLNPPRRTTEESLKHIIKRYNYETTYNSKFKRFLYYFYMVMFERFPNKLQIKMEGNEEPLCRFNSLQRMRTVRLPESIEIDDVAKLIWGRFERFYTDRKSTNIDENDKIVVGVNIKQDTEVYLSPVQDTLFFPFNEQALNDALLLGYKAIDIDVHSASVLAQGDDILVTFKNVDREKFVNKLKDMNKERNEADGGSEKYYYYDKLCAEDSNQMTLFEVLQGVDPSQFINTSRHQILETKKSSFGCVIS
jgi:hypothetical protein